MDRNSSSLANTVRSSSVGWHVHGYRLHIHVAQYLGTSFYFARISEFQSIDFHSFTAAYFETMLMVAIGAATWHPSPKGEKV